ncbi:MAG TPA: hypothetical protein PKE42_08615 [Arachnia sp.]|nr:hypothetical protein [Arachnia sp.]
MIPLRRVTRAETRAAVVVRQSANVADLSVCCPRVDEIVDTDNEVPDPQAALIQRTEQPEVLEADVTDGDGGAAHFWVSFSACVSQRTSTSGWWALSPLASSRVSPKTPNRRQAIRSVPIVAANVRSAPPA